MQAYARGWQRTYLPPAFRSASNAGLELIGAHETKLSVVRTFGATRGVNQWSVGLVWGWMLCLGPVAVQGNR